MRRRPAQPRRHRSVAGMGPSTRSRKMQRGGQQRGASPQRQRARARLREIPRTAKPAQPLRRESSDHGESSARRRRGWRHRSRSVHRPRSVTLVAVCEIKELSWGAGKGWAAKVGPTVAGGCAAHNRAANPSGRTTNDASPPPHRQAATRQRPRVWSEAMATNGKGWGRRGGWAHARARANRRSRRNGPTDFFSQSGGGSEGGRTTEASHGGGPRSMETHVTRAMAARRKKETRQDIVAASGKAQGAPTRWRPMRQRVCGGRTLRQRRPLPSVPPPSLRHTEPGGTKSFGECALSAGGLATSAFEDWRRARVTTKVSACFLQGRCGWLESTR